MCLGVKYDHIMMLILHYELLHPDYVEKYKISGDVVTIIESQK